MLKAFMITTRACKQWSRIFVQSTVIICIAIISNILNIYYISFRYQSANITKNTFLFIPSKKYNNYNIHINTSFKKNKKTINY